MTRQVGGRSIRSIGASAAFAFQRRIALVRFNSATAGAYLPVPPRMPRHGCANSAEWPEAAGSKPAPSLRSPKPPSLTRPPLHLPTSPTLSPSSPDPAVRVGGDADPVRGLCLPRRWRQGSPPAPPSPLSLSFSFSLSRSRSLSLSPPASLSLSLSRSRSRARAPLQQAHIPPAGGI